MGSEITCREITSCQLSKYCIITVSVKNSPNKKNLSKNSKNNHTLILFGTMRGLMTEMSTKKNAKSGDNSAQNLSTRNRVGREGANYNYISFIEDKAT